jgi:magnesium chelatase accessory protein
MNAASANTNNRLGLPQGGHAGTHSVAGQQAVPAGPNTRYSSFIDSGGLHWHVQLAGQGPVLLLLHGTGSATHSWRQLLPLLAQRYTVLAADLPGHGYTCPKPRGALTLPYMAGAVAGLLDTMAVSPQAVVGHSAGAAIMLRMALDGRISPQRLVGLNAALMPFGGALQHAFAPLARLLSSVPGLAGLIAAQAAKPGTVERLISSTGSHLGREAIADYRRVLSNPGHVAATLSMMAGWDLAPLLHDLPGLVPGLSLVVGEADGTVAPEQAAQIQAQLPAAKVIRLAGLGHLAHEEDADRVARVLFDELGTVAND